MTDTEKMQLTIELAQDALRDGEMPIAAVVYQANQIVAKAHTSVNRDRRFLVHAELKALFETGPAAVHDVGAP